VTRVPRDRPLTLADAAFLLGYFALLGVMIDTLYRVLGLIFGDSPAPGVVLSKLAVDMVGFSGLISMPMAVLLFAWRDADYSVGGAARLLANGGFLRRYVPLIVTCCAFWVPVMMSIYSLPVPVQFLVAVLAEAAWSLLLVHMASKRLPV
jgi:hypothetical protein